MRSGNLSACGPMCVLPSPQTPLPGGEGLSLTSRWAVCARIVPVRWTSTTDDAGPFVRREMRVRGRAGAGAPVAWPRRVRGREGRVRVSAGLRRQAGFTLVELAVVIAILGLVLGTMLAPLRAQIDAARIREAERMLGEIREALIGHAITRGALPCPDVVSDGIDGVAPAACAGTALAGVLPYQTLGVGRADPWGRHFGYRVAQEFSNRVLTCSSTCVLSVWTA